MKPIRMFLTALAMIGLAGCYTSKAPLIGENEGATPYKKITFINEDNKPLEFVLEGKSYKATNEDGSSLLRLKSVEGDYYVAQISNAEETDPSTMSILYAYMRLDGPGGKADLWKMVGSKEDVRPGLSECDDSICIDDLQAFIDYAKEDIAANKPPETTMKIEVE